ncbi:hypothetical protein [Actinacidiphila sp. ITFR-21]|uniref:hypothetical protein n=1 Tax=Actinacidiphila sp. ITFR-21 TaxID=3075199 RepID=UPI00288B399E|nr:hypothetical protein [Streptomyces sp. ITFR-21]WNI16172.1 hypothetical protein RLT57_11940 [Streptomyces sp. ITFR-21]
MTGTDLYFEYFERLTALLRDRGMPADRIEPLVSELADYAREAGGEPDEEFGPVEELAGRLAARGGARPEPDPAEADGETWVWTADAFQELRLLDRFGAQGWEVERIDRGGRFVCRRAAEQPMRWRYRRETAGGRRRAELVDRLAPEGWELFGVWGPAAYFKRPEAASTGPAAELPAPPPPPRRRTYVAPWTVGFVVVCLAAVVVLAWRGPLGIDLSDTWMLVGAGVALGAGAGAVLALWRAAGRNATAAATGPVGAAAAAGRGQSAPAARWNEDASTGGPKGGAAG